MRASALALLAAFAAGCLAAPPYRGPRSPHFDGDRFENLRPDRARGFTDFLRWQLESESKEWPDWVEAAPATPPPPRVEHGVRVTFVNHATLLIQLGGLNILTDPVWSERVTPVSWIGPKRHHEPGLRFEDLPRIHLVLVSHNHYDHMDVPTLRALEARDLPLILVGLGGRRLLEREGLRRVGELGWWQSLQLGFVRVTFTPAQHWSGRAMVDRNVNQWGSFYLRHRDVGLYFAGDTAAGPHFAEVKARLGAPTVALLPIGAYEPRWFMRTQHLDPADALDAHAQLGAETSIAMHFGTFDLSDEAIDDPPRALAEERAARGLPPAAFRVLPPGGVYAR